MPQFRAKARAVDLLGKGQIADLPTAISELWKNGYDAYATKVTAEIYLTEYKGLNNPIFVITDNGKGMSSTDIFDKWLVLGTDSKTRLETEEEGVETLWLKPRIKAGEKGIGRLSIAFLGSPMLMLTKRIGYPLQAMYFDWRLLENYNLFLDDVQLPVQEVASASSFSSIFLELKTSFLKNFDKTEDAQGKLIWETGQEKLRKDIVESTENLSLPDFFDEELISDLVSLRDDHGTRFIIFEPEQQILELINADPKDTYNEFVRTSLAGFTNQFKETEPPVLVEFPIHKSQREDYDYLTGSGKFFSYNDFDLGDILIDGQFDGTGNFDGQIRAYDSTIAYTFSKPRKKDSRSNYGRFKIKVGYLMGIKDDSQLEGRAWEILDKKVERFGALYIYRDNFRVLPYGRTDFDFLEFEKKRSKRAGRYFFSHRRMFGFIELTRKQNELLRDKSGREGLINNAAYRAFKSDLEGFFNDLALEYFGDRAKDKSVFLDKKADVKNRNQALEQDKERERLEKIAFTKSLKEYPEKLKNFQVRYSSALSALQQKLDESAPYSELEDTLTNISKLDIEYNTLLPKIPVRYEPTETQLDRLDTYEQKLKAFNKTMRSQSMVLISEAKNRLAIKELRAEFEKNYLLYKADLEALINNSKNQLNDKFKSLTNQLTQAASPLIKELDGQREKSLSVVQSKDEVLKQIDIVRQKYQDLRDKYELEIQPTITHIARLSLSIDEELVQGSYKAEYDKIRAQWDQTRETAQLGIAVEIIDHEFNVLYSQINSSFLKIEKDPGISSNKLVQNIRSLFEQLENKYELLSPLYRIAGISAKDVSGEHIYEYLKTFFERKLVDDKIDFKATRRFRAHSIIIKEPVIHTAYINIINNALYWLQGSERKEIRLDYLPETEEILILNSGKPIVHHRLNKIFDLFYSNRPNGRGIGLFLTKQSLEENYFTLFATDESDYNSLGGACFVIKPTK